MMTSTASVLEMEGVEKAYGPVRALRGVDLVVPRGGLYGIVGPNGAGKTTLFSVISGFLRPDRGTVKFLGSPIGPAHMPPPGRMAILPQDARFMGHVTVGAQLRFYAELGGMGRRAADAEARRVLDAVGLPEVFGRTIETLSHGMGKRVGIAQAFLGEPDLIILDEPTAGLDPHAAGEIRARLRCFAAGRTVIVSSHNLAEVEDLCANVAILHQGKIVQEGRIEDLVSGSAEVSFRMSAAPGDEVLDALRAHPRVAEVRWEPETGRLRVQISESSALESAGGELAALLAGRGVRFLEMQIGTTLEERFIAETGGRRS